MDCHISLRACALPMLLALFVALTPTISQSQEDEIWAEVMRQELEDITALWWSPDGSRLAMMGRYSTLYIWDLSGEDISPVLLPDDDGDRSTTALAWSPDWTQLAVAQYRWETRPTIDTDWIVNPDFHIYTFQEITIWNTISWELVKVLDGPSLEVDAMAWSSDGDRLIAATRRRGVADNRRDRPGSYRSLTDYQELTIWRLSDEKILLANQYGPFEGWQRIAWDADWTRLATINARARVFSEENVSIFDPTVRIWDIASGEQIAALEGGHGREMSVLAWSPDGAYLATDTEAIWIWDTATWETVASLGAYQLVDAIAWSPGGGSLAAVAWMNDTTALHIWDTATWDEVTSIEVTPVLSLAWSRDGSMLSGSFSDGTVRIWERIDQEAE